LDLNVNKIKITPEKVINFKIEQNSAKNLQENIDKIRSIMIEGALSQFSFEKISDAQKGKVFKNEKNEKNEIFDF